MNTRREGQEQAESYRQRYRELTTMNTKGEGQEMSVSACSTETSGQRYRVTVDGSRLQFILNHDGANVLIYTPASCLGAYKIERFEGGVLSPASIRAFVRENFKRPAAA